MSTKLYQSEIQLRSASAPTKPLRPGTVPVEKVLDDVRRDSQSDAEQFLDEVVVPKGGE